MSRTLWPSALIRNCTVVFFCCTWLFGCLPLDTGPDDQPLTWQRLSSEADLTNPSSAVEKAAEEIEIPAELSLEQAVFSVLRNNRDLRIKQLNPVVMGTFEAIEKGEFVPELFASMDYLKEEISETSRSSGTRFNVQADERSETVGIRQLLTTGTEFEIALEHQRSTSNRTPEQQENRLGLSLTQQLLQGFGSKVNLIKVHQARLDTQASLDELRGYTETLVAQTEIAYWQYALAAKEIAIYQSSLAVAQQQLDEIEEKIEVGLLPVIEAAAARTETALRVQALIDARSRLENRRLQLLRLIGSADKDSFAQEFTAVSNLTPEPHPSDTLDERLKLAQRSRPDLNEARRRLKRQELETVLTANGLLPRLEFFIELGKTGFGESFSRALGNMSDQTYDFNAGIRLSHLLGQHPGKARHLAAGAERQQAVDAIANLRRLIEFEVRLAVNETQRSLHQIDAGKQTRIAQEETLRAEKERFEVGTATALQVAQAQRDLLSCRIAEIEALVDYRTAMINLYLAEGSLLQRRGIEVQGSLNQK